MLLLNRTVPKHNLYKIFAADTPVQGSVVSLFFNVGAMATTMPTLSRAYNEVEENLMRYGMSVPTVDKLFEFAEPLWGRLRNGLGFDWVINHIVAKLNMVYPFTASTKFKGTTPFIEKHSKDPVFKAELDVLDKLIDGLIYEVFGEFDPTLLMQLVNEAATNNLSECKAWIESDECTIPDLKNYTILEAGSYIGAIILMLESSVGLFKRTFWHTQFDDIEKSEHDMVLINGNQSSFMAYGRIGADPSNEQPKWHRLGAGLQFASDNNRSPDQATASPDDLTYFSITDDRLIIEENTSFNIMLVGQDGTKTDWLSASEFSKVDLELNKPSILHIKGRLVDVGGEIIVGNDSEVVFKDRQMFAEKSEDSQAVAVTQIVFTGSGVEFSLFDEEANETKFKNVLPKRGESIEWL